MTIERELELYEKIKQDDAAGVIRYSLKADEVLDLFLRANELLEINIGKKTDIDTFFYSICETYYVAFMRGIRYQKYKEAKKAKEMRIRRPAGKYTADNWKKDSIFSAKPGQEIDQEIYLEFYNSMQPLDLPEEVAQKFLEDYHTEINSGFLAGEPSDCDQEGLLYMAFGSYDSIIGTRYFYLGLSHSEEDV